ncbi:hypothetical protein GW932_04765 [archaeon]|nr:hypothetical protein [archaeon]
MNRLEKQVVSSISILADELRVLSLAGRHEGKILMKDIQEKNIDIQTPIYLIKLGYLKIDSKTEKDYPYCDYEITEDGKKYSHQVEEFLNYHFF